MGVLGGNPQEQPMHYGEIFSVWSYLAAVKAKIAGYQTYINHAGDEDIVKFMQDRVDEGRRELEQLEPLLKSNGIALPPAPPEPPNAHSEDIPVGAKFTDPDISTMLGRDLGEGMIACSTIIAQCTREDIAMMFAQFHTSKTQFAGRLLRMNKEKGWLIPPPLHVDTPEPVHS